MDDSAPRGYWSLGRVLEVLTGWCGRLRSRLKTLSIFGRSEAVPSGE